MIKFKEILIESDFPYFTVQNIVDYILPEFSENIEGEDYNLGMDSPEDFAESVLKVFEELPDPVPIWRVIAINKKSDINWDNLGNSWTFDLKSLQNSETGIYGGEETKKKKWAIISAKIYKHDVNWLHTISHYIAYSADELVGGGSGEDEIKVENVSNLIDVKLEKIINFESKWV